MSAEQPRQDKPRVCVLFGGRSGEHEVSIRSAISVTSALDHDAYDVVTVGITKEGEWAPDAAPVDFHDAWPGACDLTAALGFLRDCDIVFPVLHGPYGEDGTVQGLLEMLDLPYVGAGVLGSALGMDKAVAKQLFARHGLPVVPHVEMLRSEWAADPHGTVEALVERIGLPCFVKPANLGSSVGITKAHDADELGEGLAVAAEYDRKILIEKAIEAREIECGLLGNDAPAASVCGEIVPCREWYDYEAKYVDERSALLIPAPIEPHEQRETQRIAVEAFRALDCCGMARADFLLCKRTGKIWLNELNTIPGFTTISMYPKLWEASGLPYPDLLDRLIELGFERHRKAPRRLKAHAAEER